MATESPKTVCPRLRELTPAPEAEEASSRDHATYDKPLWEGLCTLAPRLRSFIFLRRVDPPDGSSSIVALFNGRHLHPEKSLRVVRDACDSLQLVIPQ